MELALSLGDAPKQFLFLDKNPNMGSNNNNKDLGFCMALGTTNYDHEDNESCRRIRTTGSSDPPIQLNLLPSVPVMKSSSTQLRFPWLTDNLAAVSEPAGSDEPAPRGGLDVNRFPVVVGMADEAEDAAAPLSSPNSTVSSFQMDFGVRRSKRDLDLEVMDIERAGSRASDDDENGSTRKKLRLSKDQSAFLEESFKEHSTLNPKQKVALAKQLNLRPRQVEVWFQNRRARTKLKQTEVDCEYLKRCCETLTEENRRLHKELQELRALKTSHPFYMQLPATTLTMCPSCERVVTTASANTATTNPTATNATIKSSASSPSSIGLTNSHPRLQSHSPFGQAQSQANKGAA